MDRSDEAFSAFVSDTMDNMGYDSNMVQHRRDMYNDIYDADNAASIIAGSKGEGITRYMENDVDEMVIPFNDVGCTENENVSHVEESDYTLFQMDRRHTAPGYTRLRSNYFISRFDDHLEFDLFDRDISIGYVSHSILDHIMADAAAPYYFPKKGPAFYSNSVTGFQVDRVPSMKCNCPNILVSWLSRRRTNDWPSQQTISQVSTLDAHVVTVGYKHSPHKNIEWRICFTLGELVLIHNLNDTQLKMYVLLKLIAKSVLKPVCEAMTSYVMKNIVLWVCENTPSRLFTPRLLVDRLLQCLKIIRLLVRQESIPSYMIPERNLFIERKVPGQQQRLLSLLSELIDEGPCVLLRCDKPRLAMVKMYKTPETVRRECQIKNQVERLVLLLTSVGNKTTISSFTNTFTGFCELMPQQMQQRWESVLYRELLLQMLGVVFPDMEQLASTNDFNHFMKVSFDRLKMILS